MKKYKLAIALFVSAIVLVIIGCGADTAAPRQAEAPEEAAPAAPRYESGRYRGIYGDGGEQQVSVQFNLDDGLIRDVSFRHLFYSGTSFRNLEESATEYPVWAQHQQIAAYLEGKPVEAIGDLRNTGDFVEDVDGYSGATIRGAKLYSAFRDGLNRRLYQTGDTFSREIGSYADGRYRGIYGDSGVQQVSIQFDLAGNTLSNVSYRHLFYGGNSFRNAAEGSEQYPVFLQHQQITAYLEGKPLAAIFDLYSPGDFVDDIDGYSGATVRANKLFSAMVDGLNRNLYTPAGAISTDIGTYQDGRYRGTYEDSGVQQISIQFNLQSNTINDVSFRHLFYSGDNFRQKNPGDVGYPVTQQHEQIVQYLEGKPLSTIFELHSPGDFLDDIDGYSGATVRGNKVFSAMVDALNRGLY